jgi:hypothetical protein
MSIFQKLIAGSLLIALIFISGCYSFSGITIDPNVRTYKVNLYEDNTLDALPGLDQIFTEDLKEKIRTQSRLTYADQNPDVEFTGAIVDYRITSEAPQQGETTAINRLTIKVLVEFTNSINPDKNWKKNFDFFYDWDTATDFISVQDEAIETIATQINEYIFNEAFNDW